MIYRSGFDDIVIPQRPLQDDVLQLAESEADRAALVEGPTGRTWTFAQLQREVAAVGAGLAARGWKKGDVLAHFSPNLPEYSSAFLGNATIGGINTTINPLATAGELAGQLKDARARYLVTVPPLAATACEAAANAGVETVFVYGDAPDDSVRPFAELRGDPGACPKVSINPAEDLVALPYSSGTTGLPKGVMLTHQNLVANLAQLDSQNDIGPGDVLIAILPFFHIYGMVVVMNGALRRGATVVTMPKFDFEEFLRTLEKYRVTHAYLVPPILLALAKHPLVDQFDLSAVREVLSGAAPLSKELSIAVRDRIGCRVRQGYGLTETSPVTHLSPLDASQTVYGSAGRLVASTEAQIVDLDDQRPLGRNERGEIWIRGPQVMQGYLERPEETAHCLDDDGWFHTGDIGYVDDDDNFFVVDRLKELIKVKGFQVAPAELEAMLLTHPAIADAAVIPVPDEESGEIPKAYVVTSEPVTAEAVMEFVERQVSRYKRIRRVAFVDAIPKSASGKILRRVLVERERAG